LPPGSEINTVEGVAMSTVRAAVVGYARLTILLLGSLVAPPPAHSVDKGPRTLQVLFIGNSFTYSTNIAGLVAGISQAQKDGPRIEYRLIVHSGATLRSHLENGRAATALEEQHWDYVVLQEQGSLGGDIEAEKPTLGSPEQMRAAVTEFLPKIRAAGATPILMMTWARNLPRKERVAQQAQLTEAYESVGKTLGIKVAPVGLAWEEAFRLMPSLVLHASDNAHPSQLGGYLGACVVYAALTGMNPQGAPATILGNPVTVGANKLVLPDTTETVPLADLGAAMAGEMQKIAWKVVSAK
jgi:hypothetical protein